MARDYTMETEQRVQWIKGVLSAAGAGGVVFGSSGGKDSALVGILCARANRNTLGVIMPCEIRRNFRSDKNDAMILARHYDIEHIEVDLTKAKKELVSAIGLPLSLMGNMNIAPRLRLAAAYAIAASKNYLVAGCGNASEAFMGYFTKWGIDGACDFNPIADLTATEVLEFLRHLHAPEVFLTKAPSAGLAEGQTDEEDMGVTYAEIDAYILTGAKGPNFDKIKKYHESSQHKRKPFLAYGSGD